MKKKHQVIITIAADKPSDKNPTTFHHKSIQKKHFLSLIKDVYEKGTAHIILKGERLKTSP